MSKANGFTRHEIMRSIKIHGSMTADDLANELGISPVAVRQHVGALEAEGYVETTVERRGLGRPVHRYGLTAAGDETFPRKYDQLAMTILDEVRTLYGEEAVEQVLAGRRKKTAAALRLRLEGLPPRERIAELVEAQNGNGYMVEASEADGCITLKEHNCPICRIAKTHPSACREELQLFRELLGPECSVEVEDHLSTGAPACTYRIRVNETPVLAEA